MTTMTSSETRSHDFTDPWTIETKHAPVTARIGHTFSIGHRQGGIRLATEVSFTVEGLDYHETLIQVNGTELHRPCGECVNGTRPEYLHVHEGVCYRCGGRGYSSRSWANANNAAAALARTAAAYRAEVEERASREAEELDARLVQLAAERERAHEEALRMDAQLAAARWLGEVGDKVTFTGTVRVAMLQDGYAYGSTQVFLVVEGPDFTAKMTTTAAWAYEVERGAEVTLTATVKAQQTRGAFHDRAGERVTLVKAPKLVK